MEERSTRKRPFSSSIWILWLTIGGVALAAWLWQSLVQFGYPASIPQQVDVSSLVECDLPDRVSVITDMLDVSIFAEGWSGSEVGTNYDTYSGGRCLRSYSLVRYRDDLWSLFSLGSRPNTDIALSICICTNEAAAAESLGYYCREFGQYEDRSDFVRGQRGSWEYCISHVRVRRDMWFRKHYNSMVVLHSGNVVVVVEERMMKARWRTQEVIDLLAEGLKASSEVRYSKVTGAGTARYRLAREE